MLRQTWSTNKKKMKTNRSVKSFYIYFMISLGGEGKKENTNVDRKEKGYNNKSWKLLPQLLRKRALSI